MEPFSTFGDNRSLISPMTPGFFYFLCPGHTPRVYIPSLRRIVGAVLEIKCFMLNYSQFIVLVGIISAFGANTSFLSPMTPGFFSILHPGHTPRVYIPSLGKIVGAVLEIKCFFRVVS